MVATIEDAHGVNDINCVSFAPRSIASDNLAIYPDIEASGATKRDGGEVQISEIQDADDANERNVRAGGHSHLCDLLASAADDGTLKIWAVPESPLRAGL